MRLGPDMVSPALAHGQVDRGAAPPQPDRPSSPVTSESRPLRSLIDALDGAGVRYCHWKSNIRLLESLDGEGDLDLLVDRRDAAAFQVALAANGFKFAGSATGIGHPGVLHAFALDPERAELVHVHAYYQIVTGDSLVKSYRLPFEKMLLSDTRRMHGVPVPSAEAELVAFTLRVALKHVSPLEVLLLNRHYDSVVEELAWLQGSADLPAAEELWCTMLPGAPVSLFRDLQTAIADPKAVWRRNRLARELAPHIAVWRRLSPLSTTASRMWRLGVLALGRLRRRRGLIPQTSGMIVAFVGPKATGKSTLSTAVCRRLGRHLSVRQVHVGKPPPTAATFLVRLLLPSARRLFARHRPSDETGSENKEKRSFSRLYILRQVLLAYERRALLRRCWQDAAAGSIVVTDRYPSARPGASDSGRFEEADIERCRSGFDRWLMRRERALYSGLPQPTLVLRLSASIETAIRRDAEREKDAGPNAAALARRRLSETVNHFPGVTEVGIETERPLDETIRAATQAVWAMT